MHKTIKYQVNELVCSHVIGKKRLFKGQCHNIFTKNILCSKSELKVSKIYFVNSFCYISLKIQHAILNGVLSSFTNSKREFSVCHQINGQNANTIQLSPQLMMTIRSFI